MMFATLSDERIAFYSTAATVMPVLTLGSLLAVATLARTAARWLDEVSTGFQHSVRRFMEAELVEFQAKRTGRLILKTELAMLDWSLSGLGRRTVKPLLLLAFLLPTAAEITALVALAEGSGGSRREAVVWVGLSASAIIALVPIFEVLVFLSVPFALIRSALRTAADASKSVEQAPEKAPPEPP